MDSSGGAQKWDFGAIEGGAGELSGAVSRVEGLLQEGAASLAALQSVWGGSGSEAYLAVQTRWDNASTELNLALKQLGLTISEAGATMAQTEAAVTAKFV
jgi:early secretory antigenic target protein ESAT-6